MENNFMQWRWDHHNQEDGSRETQKIGPVLEVTTSCLYCQHGVEIRIWSLSEDNTHSWVRLSHRSNKCVIDSNHNNTNFWRSAWRTSVTTECEGLCIPIKGKSKTTKKGICWFFIKNSAQGKELDRRLYTRGLWSISVFSRVEQWSCRARSIREPWENFLGCIAKKLPLIVKNLFLTEMRIPEGTENSFTIERGNLCQCITKNRQISEKFRHGQWRSRICEQSQRPSAK